VDHCVESIDIIGGVGHRALETIGIQDGVGSHHIAAIAGLHLALDITGDAVMDAIGEVIPRGGLQLYLLQDWSRIQRWPRGRRLSGAAKDKGG